MTKEENEEWEREYDAPEGYVWVCGACGRHGKNRTRIGDESCFMNGVLAKWDEAAKQWVAKEGQ